MFSDAFEPTLPFLRLFKPSHTEPIASIPRCDAALKTL
jgi:hypothetical protein